MGQPPQHTDVRFWRDPDLPGVEARWSSYREEAFRDHTHAAFSVGFLESGRTTFTLEGVAHTARAGQMVLIPPDAVHACNPDTDTDMTYRMFYVDPPWLETVAAEVFGRDTGVPRFPEPVVDDSVLVARWRELHDAIRAGADRLHKESLLVQGLADLLARHAELGEPAPQIADPQAVRLAKDHLAGHLSHPVSLAELSEVAHLSRYHLLRVFREATGMPPHAYHTQLRVNLGKRLLADGASVSRAAAETGFADQSHFSRVFRQYTGATPGQYRAGA